MEIITGIERRRRWSAEEKLWIVADTERADGGIAEIARRYEISRGLLWNRRSQVRLPGSVRFNCTPDLAISVKVRIRLLMLAFWDIGVRASEGPASGFCLLAGIRRSEFALRPLCRPSWPLRGPALQRPCHTLPSGAATASYRSSWGQRQRRKAAGEAQGAREPAEILGSDGVFQRAHPPGDTVDSAGSVSSPEFAAIG